MDGRGDGLDHPPLGLLTRAGADLDASDRTEAWGLLSGSEAAETTLAKLAPEAAEQVDRVVREAFVSR